VQLLTPEELNHPAKTDHGNFLRQFQERGRRGANEVNPMLSEVNPMLSNNTSDKRGQTTPPSPARHAMLKMQETGPAIYKPKLSE